MLRQIVQRVCEVFGGFILLEGQFVLAGPVFQRLRMIRLGGEGRLVPGH